MPVLVQILVKNERSAHALQKKEAERLGETIPPFDLNDVDVSQVVKEGTRLNIHG